MMRRRYRHSMYGLMAEFERPEALVAAARKAREAGYTRMDAYSPYPVEGLADALKFKGTMVPLLVLIGGVIGCIGGFMMQYWISGSYYPINVGGRPLNSWPSFIPITFELTILVAALSAVLGMLALNGLPQPYHPVFNVERFALASRDRFFLAIESGDPKFDVDETRALLKELGAKEISDVDY